MLATIWVYALFFGWLFAVGFVLLIFLHEMGHAYVIKQKGLRAGAPVFIPFVGAMIALKDQPRDAKTEAEIAYGGPLAGALASLGCYYLGEEWGSPLLLGLAYTGFFMNLFNLIPVSPLDGGRIVTAISTKLWIVGLFLLLFLFLRSFNPLLLIVLVMGGIQLWQVYRQGDQTSAYYEVPPSYRTAMAIAYFGLAGFLGAMIMKVLPMLPALR
jgi:Zn-dependent protease